MKDLAVIDNSKDFLTKIMYNIRYVRKLKKFNIDKSLSDTLIDRRKDKAESEILGIIGKSKNKESFEENVKNYLKSKERNVYASILLLGNMTGKYKFNSFYYERIKDLDIDAFSKQNKDLLLDLKSHFYEYVINNNMRKNSFAKKIGTKEKSIRDLSQDIDEDSLAQSFDQFLNGEEVNDSFKSKVLTEYIMKCIGIYSREDIKSNFDFILYDLNNDDHTRNIDERRQKFKAHRNLSINQLRKIEELHVLEERLSNIDNPEANSLLLRLNKIKNNCDENISEIEEIYADYEFLYRQDLIDNLYVPKEDITIIDNYKDLKPQLVHQFLRSTKKMRSYEIEKLKEEIISERLPKDDNKQLTNEEQERLNKMMAQTDANLDQYKVNYTIDGKNSIYSGPLGIDLYHSDTSNQISAGILSVNQLMLSRQVGIIGVGFNKETLTPEAIAISSNSYKTTNKGINNLEYYEEAEFEEMSAPFQELIRSDKSEVVMHRRGLDFDTKASYILAQIDSSNEQETKEIMQQINEIREKEGLKVVIHDIYKIRKSYELDNQKEESEDEKIGR